MLQNRRHLPRGEDVTGEKQDGQAVDRGAGRPCDHVRGSRTDGARARERLKPVGHLGEARRRVDERLFVPAGNVGQIVPRREQGFAETGDVPMAEDTEHLRDEAPRDGVAPRVLVDEEVYEGLSRGQASGLHRARSLLRL